MGQRGQDWETAEQQWRDRTCLGDVEYLFVYDLDGQDPDQFRRDAFYHSIFDAGSSSDTYLAASHVPDVGARINEERGTVEVMFFEDYDMEDSGLEPFLSGYEKIEEQYWVDETLYAVRKP